MEKKTIVARVEVLPGKEQAFLQAADALIKGTRAEEGNISYNLYQNPSQPVAFIFYEEYKDQRAMDIHAASPHFQAFGKAIKEMLASDLIIETFLIDTRVLQCTLIFITSFIRPRPMSTH